MLKRRILLELLNNRLLNDGIISEEEHSSMQLEIEKKYHCNKESTGAIINSTHIALNAAHGGENGHLQSATGA